MFHSLKTSRVLLDFSYKVNNSYHSRASTRVNDVNRVQVKDLLSPNLFVSLWPVVQVNVSRPRGIAVHIGYIEINAGNFFNAQPSERILAERAKSGHLWIFYRPEENLSFVFLFTTYQTGSCEVKSSYNPLASSYA